MRRVITILTTILVTISFAYAVRASGVPVVFKQADGTSLTIIVQGDEYSRYTTTIDGYQIIQHQGCYYYWSADPLSKSGQGLIRASDPANRSMSERSALIGRAMGKISGSTYGATRSESNISLSPESRAVGVQPKYVLVILAQFSDVKFQLSSDRSSFNYMLNTAPKSAQRYFSDNSMGVYVPTFDVSPIVTLPRNRAYYGANTQTSNGSAFDGHPDEMIRDACRLAAEQMGSFSKYDSNSDGYVDNVFVLFAGHNEAEGGGDEAIWPHQSSVIGTPSFGGVRVSSYICSSELRGASGTTFRSGIGTFCHEFCHVLGLPDFYDTDYGQGGASAGLYNLSLMSSGNYNDEGHTPPYFNAYERHLLKWNTLTELTVGESKSLRPIQNENNAYFFSSKVSANEFYVVEYRDGSQGVWDKFFGASYSGVLIYHVDRSNNDSGNGVKAITRWSNNTVNANASHPCMRIVPSSEPSAVDFTAMLFPGINAKTTFTGKHKEGLDWRRNPIMVELIDIVNHGSTATFSTRNSQGTGEVMSFTTSQREVDMIFSTTILADRFTVSYKPSNSENSLAWRSLEVVASENRVKIEDLTPNTSYDVELSAINGSTSTLIAKSKFVTMPFSAPFPAINGIQSMYSLGDDLTLSVTNINFLYTAVSFAIDGTKINSTQYKLNKQGTFTLSCTITYSEQDIEVITRKIVVK